MNDEQKKEIKFPCPHNWNYAYTDIKTCEQCSYSSTCDVYVSMIDEDFD